VGLGGDLQHGSDSGSCTTGGGNPYGGVHPEQYGGCTSDGVFHSGIHTTPFSYTFTFTQSGTFKYFCDVHMSAMTGRVVVNPAPTGSSATAAPWRTMIRDASAASPPGFR
jgi:hypothetical protein